MAYHGHATVADDPECALNTVNLRSQQRNGWRSYGLICQVLMLVLLLSACAQQPLIVGDSDTDCAQRLVDFERRAAASMHFLSEPRAVPAFPAVASNRFLASFDPRAMSAIQREDWLARLLAAGERRRDLIADMRDTRAEASAVSESERRVLNDCARSQAHRLQGGDADRWDSLSHALQVADDYSLWRRILGVYPLTSLGAKSGVRDLQAELQHSYTLVPEDIPTEGRLQAYWPSPRPTDSTPAPPQSRLPEDSLGALMPDAGTLAALLQQHAPVWHLDQQGEYDRPGRPYFNEEGRPRVDTADPQVFVYASLTRFESVARLQLNYLLWFDGRPRQGVFDTLGGRLDGLLWRVTLDEQGAVLLYDSVHACGCYHLFFPGPGLEMRPEAQDWPEPPLVMRRAVSLENGERPVLWVSSVAHYLQGISVSQANATLPTREFYRINDYRGLYFVDHPMGERSLFDRHGIVPGTQRRERFYLWPMGIRSPGAMRERGRQATAFIGRRHFDDADLMEQIFRKSD